MAPSVALVVLDTLRTDAFEAHFDWIGGQRFESVLSPSHWTTPVHASLFTGMYPSEAGVHATHPSLDTSEPTITEKLAAAGWTCRGYSANGNVSSSTNFDRGFHDFTAKGYHTEADIFDWQTFIAESPNGLTRYPRAFVECVRSDCDTIPSLRQGIRRKYDHVRYGGSPNLTAEDALDYIIDTQFGDREFLFVNLMEAHPAYTPPEEYQTVAPDSLNSIDAIEAVLNGGKDVDEDRIKQAYADSVRYLADMYKQIHERLQEDFDYVITVSDHGETFGEQGIYGHVPSLVPEIVRVPLVISGDVPSGTVSTPANVLDINQTISTLTGVADPPRGQNLLDPTPQATITEAHGISEWQRRGLRDRGITAEQLRPIDCQKRGVATEGYYGYESLYDSWVDAEGDIAEPETLLESVVSSIDTPENQDTGVSDGARRQLEDMGYI